jgi:hypothetical protein
MRGFFSTIALLPVKQKRVILLTQMDLYIFAMTIEYTQSNPTFIEKTRGWVLNYPGFFTPYSDLSDCLYTVASPVLAPIVLSSVACDCFFAGLILPMVTILFSPVILLLAAFCNQPQWFQETLEYATARSEELLKASAVYTGLALLSIVGAPIGLVTRTITSIIDGIINFFAAAREQNSAMQLS